MILSFFKISFLLLIVAGLLISLGVGIIKLIDYLEENPYGSVDFMKKILVTTALLHILFLCLGVPILQILFSLSILYAYFSLFDVYPFIRPSDSRFLYGVIASLVNYFLMIRFISLNNVSLFMIIPCFLIIWTTPVCFFFSITATEEALFVKKGGKKNKTYAGMAIDWVFKLGRDIKNRE